MGYIDDRVYRLSSTQEVGQVWRNLLQTLAFEQRKMARDLVQEEIVPEYFGVSVQGRECVAMGHNAGNSLFGKSLGLFRSIYAQDVKAKGGPESCGLLISMVGFSLEPVMHTVLTLRPAEVLFVFSRESAQFRPRVDTIDYLKALIDFHGENYKPRVKGKVLESTATAHVFTIVRNEINDAQVHGVIAIDVTGGKKSMDASAFLAASLFDNVAIYYVDYEDYDSQGGYPVWGSEFLNHLDNPYLIYNVREEQLVRELWEKGNYAAVKKLADSLIESLTPKKAKKYSLEDERLRFLEITKAAACYEAWLQFDYVEAGQSMFNAGTVHHGQVLEALAQCSNVFLRGQICGREYAPLAHNLAMDRYLRGHEAVQNGESNRAALCYTQAVEVLLKFAYSAERQKELNLKGEKVKILLDNLFNGHQVKGHKSFFRGERLRMRIAEDVLHQRNDLSHHSCITQPLNIREIFTRMESAVHDFLNLFAVMYHISSVEIDTFTKQATFLHLDDNLQFKVQNLANFERPTVA